MEKLSSPLGYGGRYPGTVPFVYEVLAFERAVIDGDFRYLGSRFTLNTAKMSEQSLS